MLSSLRSFAHIGAETTHLATGEAIPTFGTSITDKSGKLTYLDIVSEPLRVVHSAAPAIGAALWRR